MWYIKSIYKLKNNSIVLNKKKNEEWQKKINERETTMKSIKICECGFENLIGENVQFECNFYENLGNLSNHGCIYIHFLLEASLKKMSMWIFSIFSQLAPFI